jgi:SNF2 family DNA or RNA helicase
MPQLQNSADCHLRGNRLGSKNADYGITVQRGAVMAIITATEKKILVKSVDHHDSGLYRSIPGAIWNRKHQCWVYPRSPFVVGRLQRKLDANHIPWDRDINTAPVFDLMDRLLLKQKVKFANNHSGSIPKCEVKVATRPWLHQQIASEWLQGLPYGYLAMEMGTGKTLVSINEMLVRTPKRTLILCPKTVIDVWLDELSVHAPDHQAVVVPLKKGTSKKKAEFAAERWKDSLTMNRPLIVIVNYETAWREAVAAWILEMMWDMVIADEAHKLKAPGGRISKFAAKLHGRSDTRVLLSGTPLPNDQMDAYGQYRFMDPGIFGTSVARYRQRYAEVVTYKGFPEIVGWRNQEEFRNILDMTMFRVDKDVLDLPPLKHVQRFCTIPPKAQRVYNDIMSTFISDVNDGLITAANALTRLLRFQQITSGFITDDEGHEQHLHDEKRDLLEDIVDGIAGEPVVVFCRFRHDLETVKEVAKRVGRVYGEVSGSGNDLEGGKIPRGVDVLGVQIQAGGIGVNLNAARYAVFFSLGFSLAEYEQAVARLHRGGQKNPVTVYHLVARDTVDEQVYAALAAKKKVVGEIMAYVKGER